MSGRRNGTNPSITRRGFVLLGGQLALMGGLAWRMRQLQVEESERYRLLAEENRINMRLIPPARGEIFDRAGRPLAVNRQNFRVVIVREEAEDVEHTLDLLARLIDISPYERERALKEIRSKSAFVPVSVAEHLDWDAFARVNANSPALPGVQPEVGLTRFYPEAETLAHVVGYVGRVSEKELKEDGGATPLLQLPDFHIGKTGVETREEELLRGSAGVSHVEVNALGRVIRELDRTEGDPGADLNLTIDLELQRYAMERLAGQSAAAAMIDVTSGDVVMLASAPGFDPNKFVFGISSKDWNALLEDEHRPLASKATSGLYPPGSTFKMMVALAGLETGVMGPEERVFCNGRYKLGNRYFHCWRRGGHGHLKMRDALKHSCDVYFYETAKRAGVDAIASAARKFGLGEKLDLPLPAVYDGLIPTRDWKFASQGEPWMVGDTLNTGIGQGYVLTSPIQLATMAARLASGAQVTPRLIRAVDGKPTPVPDPAPLAITPWHLNIARDGMFGVMNERHGTAWRARIALDDLRMAGKTGTSQVRRITAQERAAGVTRNEDLPWNRRDHALFVCFAPYDKPRYALAVVVEHGGSGSGAAAPIARDLMLRALFDGEPPLEAYPPEQRDAIRQRREAPAADGATPRSRA